MDSTSNILQFNFNFFWMGMIVSLYGLFHRFNFHQLNVATQRKYLCSGYNDTQT